MAFNHYCKGLYPLNALFEDCFSYFNDENIYEVNDPAEDVCETPFQEDIHSHQEEFQSDKKN